MANKTFDDEDIRNHAFHLWEQAGRPEGQEEVFWHKAREALASGDIKPGHADRKIDRASEESFPASDAVNHM
jgi:hypothetical protein